MQVKRDCMNIFNHIDLKWPEFLDCSRFPEPPDLLCMQPPALPAPQTDDDEPNGKHSSSEISANFHVRYAIDSSHFFRNFLTVLKFAPLFLEVFKYTEQNRTLFFPSEEQD